MVSPMPMSDILLSPLQAALILGVSPRTIVRWSDDPSHPLVAAATTDGGQRRFDPSVVEAVRCQLAEAAAS